MNRPIPFVAFSSHNSLLSNKPPHQPSYPILCKIQLSPSSEKAEKDGGVNAHDFLSMSFPILLKVWSKLAFTYFHSLSIKVSGRFPLDSKLMLKEITWCSSSFSSGENTILPYQIVGKIFGPGFMTAQIFNMKWKVERGESRWYFC